MIYHFVASVPYIIEKKLNSKRRSKPYLFRIMLWNNVKWSIEATQFAIAINMRSTAAAPSIYHCQITKWLLSQFGEKGIACLSVQNLHTVGRGSVGFVRCEEFSSEIPSETEEPDHNNGDQDAPIVSHCWLLHSFHE